MNTKYQHGAAMVEFSLIALVFFIILFGLIEFARAWFVYSTLMEATRRGARVAAVCPANSNGMNQVKSTTIFNSPGDTASTGDGLLGLTKANVTVSYLDDTLTAISPAPPLADNSTTYNDIAFVRVVITGFQHSLYIPLWSNTFTVPYSFSTTLPRESLGRTSPSGTVTTRDCKF